MKKLFTIDDFAVAFVSAMGYGYGEAISNLFGWPPLACIVASFALGIALEEIIDRIAFSKTVQKKPENRLITYTVIVLLFLAAHAVSVRWMGISMMDYLLEEFAYVVGLPILGFLFNLLLRWYRIRKIRSLYGDGSKGYVFDVDDEEIEEINQQNKPVSGEYDTDCAVKTRTGVYVGEKQGKIISYLGIPFAKPPVGDLRWKAPEPLPSSETVYEAQNFGPSAVQVEHKGDILKHHRQSEDCLYLNICVSAEKTEEKKPVLVMFHHGDFTFSGTADPLMYGDDYIRNHPDIIFVSFNFRLGIFGFIDFSEVPGGEACPDALNLGLLDQIAALEWIKENIAAFGGDPERITVMGFESGAASICMLAACGRAKGLFQKAFVFSGSPEYAYETPEASRTLAENLMKETGTATMTELMQLKTSVLKKTAQKLWRNQPGPTCDGKLIPTDIYRAYKDGAASGIAFILGVPGNELPVIRSFIGRQNYDELIAAAVSDLRKSITDSISSLESKPELVEKWLTLGMHRCAATLNEGGARVHLLYWDEKPLIQNLGSGSVDAVAVMLGNDEALQIYGNVMNKDLSEVLQGFLHKFIQGNALKLYTNEIRGVDAFTWKPFPAVIIVSEGKLQCDTIEDNMAEETL